VTKECVGQLDEQGLSRVGDLVKGLRRHRVQPLGRVPVGHPRRGQDPRVRHLEPPPRRSLSTGCAVSAPRLVSEIRPQPFLALALTDTVCRGLAADLLVGKRSNKMYGQRAGVLRLLVHLEHVVRGCEDHLVAIGQDHRLKHIDGLGDVGHNRPLGVAVEDVEVDARHVARRETCSASTGTRDWFPAPLPPGASFVHHQSDSSHGVVDVHDVGVSSQ
jgi:hypothetical protein